MTNESIFFSLCYYQLFAVCMQALLSRCVCFADESLSAEVLCAIFFVQCTVYCVCSSISQDFLNNICRMRHATANMPIYTILHYSYANSQKKNKRQKERSNTFQANVENGSKERLAISVFRYSN